VAFEFRPREAALAVLAFSVVAIGSALHAARGVSIPNESLLVIQVFLSAVAMTSLLVSVTVSERNGHQGTLQKAKMELEERVLERTRELEDRIARQERAEKAVRGLSARLLQVKDQERLITGHHSAIDPRRHSTQGVCIPSQFGLPQQRLMSNRRTARQAGRASSIDF
jgi:hypothetical protein